MYFTDKKHLAVALIFGLTALIAGCSPGVQSGDISSQFGGLQGAQAISPTAVTLSWIKDPKYSAYDIYTSTQQTPILESVFSSATVENLSPETTYSFKVLGKGSTSAGGAIEESVKTWPRFTGIDRAYKNSDGAIVIEWDYAYPAAEYEIFYRANTAPTSSSTTNWTVVNAKTTTNRYIFNNLSGSTTYFFAVHARYRGAEYERPAKAISASTNSSFPFPFYDLPKITIGTLPTIKIEPVVTAQFPAINYESRVFKDGVEIADPVVGVGSATFASTIPLALGKIENISLQVKFDDGTVNETLTIAGLSTYLKGTVPYLDVPALDSTVGPAYMGQSSVTGDFNCDGYDDLAVGLPYVTLAQYGVNSAQAGAVYVYYGGLNSGGKYILKTTPAPSRTPTDPGKDPQVLTFPDLTTQANFGFSLAKGNLNGDRNGIYECDDLAVGAPRLYSPNGRPTGNVFVFFGTAGVGIKIPATVSAFPQNAETCDGRATGASCTAVRLWPDHSLWPSSVFGGPYVDAYSGSGGYNSRFGEAVSFIGDFNADGYEELAIGAPDAPWDGVSPAYIGNPAWNQSQVGYVAMYFGSNFGLGYESPLADATKKFRWLKIYPSIVQNGMRFGASIGGADVDGAYRVRNDSGSYVGGGDFVVGAPGFRYLDPSSTTFPMTSSTPDSNISVLPVDGGWWGSTSRAAATNTRYGFSQTGTGAAQGVAFAFFGRSLTFNSLVNNSNNPTLSSFWSCGRRGMSTADTHFSCMADVGDSRIIFPRDSQSYGFGTSLVVIGDKSARDATNTLKCVPSAYPGPRTSAASGPCRDANGDSFADIIVAASSGNPGDGRTGTGALWQFFGNFDKIFEAGSSDNFKTVAPYYNTEAACQNFALGGLAPANNAFNTADRSVCAPTRLIPNSIPSGAYMGLYSSSLNIGDLTRDGLLDVAVGAPYDNTNGTGAGAVFGFTGQRGFGITTNFKKMLSHRVGIDDRMGYAVAIGDFDAYGQNQELAAYTCRSDGSDTCSPGFVNLAVLPYNDIATGAPYENSANAAGGGVHLFNSGAFVLPAIRTTSDVDIYDSLASVQDYEYGNSRIVGDINGDGYDDAVSHVMSYVDSGTQAFDGVVYYGSSLGLVTSEFCLNNLSRVFKSGMESALECSPSRTHAAGITNDEILLPQKLVRPNNVSSKWAQIGFSAGDINGDGFGDVVFVDPCYSGNCTTAQILAYYGTRGGLQDIVVPNWRPASNDPQIVTRQISMNFSNTTGTNWDHFYSYANPIQHGDFNGDGYSDLVIGSPYANGPSLSNSTTAVEPYDGHTETIQDVNGWPIDSALAGTIWRCPTGSTLDARCTGGSGVQAHGAVFIIYGSSSGLATPAMYFGGSGAVDLQTPGVPLNFVYGSEDEFGIPTAQAQTQCSSMSSTNHCIPNATILRNPVLVNIKNGFSSLSHLFGAAVTPIRLSNSDTRDTLLVSAPGYEHLNCLNYPNPATQAPELDQGRIYVFRGSEFGLIADDKNTYYPAPTDGNTTKCANMPENEDTGIGIDAFGRLRALRMAVAGSPTPAEQAAGSASGVNTRNAYSRNFGLRMTNGGDINGDGHEDLVVMAPYENVFDQSRNIVMGAGAGYVFYGPLCPTDNSLVMQSYLQDFDRLNTQTLFSDAGVVIASTCAGKFLAPQKFRIKDIVTFNTGGGYNSTNENHGLSVLGGRLRGANQTGDVNLDGYADILVGSPNWDDSVNLQTNVGRGVVLFGSPNGLFTNEYPSAVVETLSANRVKPFVLAPPESISSTTFYIGNVTGGDVNGDRSMDIMVPSFTYDGVTPPGIDLGTFFLFY